MARPTWGDTVRIKNTAPHEMQPGRLAAVCGMRQIENDDHASQFGCPIGTTIYLVEFGDGHAVEIPEHLVELADD